MGLSGGSTSTSSSITGSAQDWAKPIATSQANATTGVYNQNQPQLQALATRLYNAVPGLQDRFAAGNPTLKAAQGYTTDVLSGKYLSGNPMLQQIIDKAKRGVVDSVDSQFSGAGRYGSGAYTDVLSRNLADTESSLRYQDYAGQQSRMDQAASAAPTLAQADYQGLPELLQTITLAGGLPYVGTSATADALGALFNGGTQTSTQKQSGGFLGGLGSIFSGIGSMASGGVFSDRRLKEDVREVGKTKEGLPIYTYRYKGDPQVHMGVMAQEVERKQPRASGPTVSGYKTVNLQEVR